MKSQHGMVGEFYPELIRKSMFLYSCSVIVHNMLIEYFFLSDSHIFMNAFLIENFVWALVLQIFFGTLAVGEIKPGFSLSN